MGNGATRQIFFSVSNQTRYELRLLSDEESSLPWGAYMMRPLRLVSPGFDGLVVSCRGSETVPSGTELRLVYRVGSQTLELYAHCAYSKEKHARTATATLGGRSGRLECRFEFECEDHVDAKGEESVIRAHVTLSDPLLEDGAAPSAQMLAASVATSGVRMGAEDRVARMLQRMVASTMRGTESNMRRALQRSLDAAAEGAGLSRLQLEEFRLPDGVDEFPLFTPTMLDDSSPRSDRDVWRLEWHTQSLRVVVRAEKSVLVGTLSTVLTVDGITFQALACTSHSVPMRLWLEDMPTLDLSSSATGVGKLVARPEILKRVVIDTLRENMMAPNYAILFEGGGGRGRGESAESESEVAGAVGGKFGGAGTGAGIGAGKA